jgi:hypothetical protein
VPGRSATRDDMVIPIDQLVQSSALTYTISRLTRGDSSSEVMLRLRKRYPSQPTVDLQYLIDLGNEQESLRREIAYGDGLSPVGAVPFVPGTAPGIYELDVAYETAQGRPGARQRGFFRLNIDKYDLALGTMYALGAVKGSRALTAGGGRWRQLKEVIITAGDRVVLDDLYRLFPSLFTHVEGELAQAGIPPPVIPDALREIAIRIPGDEPETIVYPPDWLRSPRLRQILNPEIIFVGRG